MILARIIEIHLLNSKIQFTTKLLIGLVSFLIIMLVITSIYYNSSLIILITRIGMYSANGVAAFLVLIFYIRLIYRTIGNVRKKFILNFMGILLFFIGIILDSELLQHLLPVYIYPIISGTGLLIFIISQKKD